LDHPKKDQNVVLSASNIHLSFGRIQVLKDVSFHINQHEILSIIGPNGAGKTSLMNCLSGFYKPQEGDIAFKGSDIIGVPMHRRVVEEIIDFLEMEFIRDGLVGELGYGLRKRVDLGRALALEPAILIMENGRIVLDGTAEELLQNEDIKEFYLGLNLSGGRRSYRNVKHYKRRKRWLG